MGVLRLLLALLVVYAHCGYPFGRVGVSAENAVQIFYMISGFYMTLVLRGKYATTDGSGVRTFYANRALRVFPAYFLIAGATLFLCLFGERLFGWEPQAARYVSRWFSEGLLDWPKLAWLALTQLSMAGLESFNFLTVSDAGTLLPTAGVSADRHELWRMLLVPQAWSLSVELYFYAVAPFIVKRGLKVLVGVALASFAVRVALWGLADLNADPWSYRFFPSELMFFMLGAIACHACSTGSARNAALLGRSTGAWALHGLLAALAVGAVLIGRADHPYDVGDVIASLATAGAFLVLPYLFAWTRNMRLDRLVGELSYPVYISHVLVIWIIGRGTYDVDALDFLCIALLTLLVGAAIYRWVDAPIDRLRHYRLRSAQAAQHGAYNRGCPGVASRA